MTAALLRVLVTISLAILKETTIWTQSKTSQHISLHGLWHSNPNGTYFAHKNHMWCIFYESSGAFRDCFDVYLCSISWRWAAFISVSTWNLFLARGWEAANFSPNPTCSSWIHSSSQTEGLLMTEISWWLQMLFSDCTATPAASRPSMAHS